jgi:glycosyltransferase involved in cell wall biosynthesis
MKLSIITPSFRSSKWLKLCIASVADQEGVEFEHIIQDSCSDDGTLEWLPEDRRVKAFIEKDRGMYDAVNRGLCRANGDILAYLNCDEQYLPGALKAVHEFFEKNPDAEVALAGTIVVDSEGQYMCHRPSFVPKKNQLWFCFPVLTSSVFFRRKIIEDRSLYFDDKWRDLGDFHWFINLLRNNVRMKIFDHYTSVFIDSGENMNMKANAIKEKNMTRDMAPQWIIIIKPLLIMHHRLRKFIAGHLRKLLSNKYAIYTLQNNNKRTLFEVSRPTTIWWNRLCMQNTMAYDYKIIRRIIDLLPDKRKRNGG